MNIFPLSFLALTTKPTYGDNVASTANSLFATAVVDVRLSVDFTGGGGGGFGRGETDPDISAAGAAGAETGGTGVGA